ncbi:MAG: hemerythrin domain-containing protein [Candidatus Binatia bacterium]
MAGRRHPTLIPLSHDHQNALALAFRLHHPSPSSTPDRRTHEVLDHFTTKLVAHFRAEEEVLFPALAARVAAGSAVALLLEALVAEHRELERLRDAIGTAGGDDAARAPLLTAFADLLERHVRIEERQLFVQFDDLVPDPDDGARIAAAIRACLGSRSGTGAP